MQLDEVKIFLLIFTVLTFLFLQSLYSPASVPLPPVAVVLGKFLHLTDLHLDEHYQEGSDPLNLCHSSALSDGNPEGGHAEVGKYGALGTSCDSPKALIDSTFQFIRTNLSAETDFVLYTGDTARHDRDATVIRTAEEIAHSHHRLVQWLGQSLNLTKTKVIMTVGNNDNFGAHDRFSISNSAKLFKFLAKAWRPFGLNLQADFFKLGCYVQALQPWLDVLSLNTMLWYSHNPKIVDCDQEGAEGVAVLNWLDVQLTQAKEKGKHVYLMGHVPPLSDQGKKNYLNACYSSFLALLAKHAPIISGQFYGHTNMDAFSFLVQKKIGHLDLVTLRSDSPAPVNYRTWKVLSVLANAPSVIPVNNPALRTYSYDRSGAEPGLLDFNQFYVDLAQANRKRRVKWKLEYKFTHAYQLPSFNREQGGVLFRRLLKNLTLRNDYMRRINVQAPPSNITEDD